MATDKKKSYTGWQWACVTHHSVFVWKVMTCFSASTSPRLKGPSAARGRGQISGSRYHRGGFWERLHSSRFISVTNHALIARFSLRRLLQFGGGEQLLFSVVLLTFTKLQRRATFGFSFHWQLLNLSLILAEKRDYQLIKVSHFSCTICFMTVELFKW